MSSSKNLYLNCMLVCGHTAVWEGVWPHHVVPDRMQCSQCPGLFLVYAVECREWHVNCKNCRYGRWFGADQAAAQLADMKHRAKYTGHSVLLTYELEPDKFVFVRKHLGRKFRVFFNQKPELRPGQIVNYQSEIGEEPGF